MLNGMEAHQLRWWCVNVLLCFLTILSLKKYAIQVRWLRNVLLVMASRADCLMLLSGLAALDDDSSCHVAQASHVEQWRGCSNAWMVLGGLLL